MSISAETFFFDPRSQGTLQQQIQEMVARGILSGRFRVGEKLPSSRKLAAHLGVSRITVTLAYTELMADAYIFTRGRSGYYVSPDAPQSPRFAPAQVPQGTGVDWNRAIGRRFSNVPRPDKPADWRTYRAAFIYGQADGTLFDHQNWRNCALRALGQREFDILATDAFQQDDPILVEYIARHTLPRRGIVAGPEEIIVTLGAQNALWIAAQVLLTQRRTATVENPGYYGLREVLGPARCKVVRVDIDADGIPPDAVPPETDVLFATPSHQAPTTVTMPLARRQALMARAAEHDFLIVEDDYEYEMSFLKAPTPALKSMDRDGRVIYVGSFSKSLFPGLRLGYMVGPAAFIREARELRSAMLRHPPGHMQRTTAYFLSLGHYDALLRRQGRAFHRRRNIMTAAIEEHGLSIAGTGSFGGSSLWMQAPEGTDTDALARRLRADGVLIEPGGVYFDDGLSPTHHYRLAYSSVPEARIPEGIAAIARALALDT